MPGPPPVGVKEAWGGPAFPCGPGLVLDDHNHPFAVTARVVQGEMWLRVGDDTRHLCAGDHFMLDAEVPHAERNGNDGATYWVARRISPAR